MNQPPYPFRHGGYIEKVMQKLLKNRSYYGAFIGIALVLQLSVRSDSMDRIEIQNRNVNRKWKYVLLSAHAFIQNLQLDIIFK